MVEKVGQGRRSAGAYDALRWSVLDGNVAPGEQIRVNEAAAALRLSATPVREALSRLVGEGLLEERARIGFFVPLPTPYDLIDLLGVAELHLIDAIRAPGRGQKPIGVRRAVGTEGVREAGNDPAARLFDHILACSDNHALIGSGRRAIDRLAPLRRAEPLLLADSAAEVSQLEEQLRSERLPQLRAGLKVYHRRRRSHAVELAYLISRKAGRNNIPDIV